MVEPSHRSVGRVGIAGNWKIEMQYLVGSGNNTQFFQRHGNGFGYWWSTPFEHAFKPMDLPQHLNRAFPSTVLFYCLRVRPRQQKYHRSHRPRRTITISRTGSSLGRGFEITGFSVVAVPDIPHLWPTVSSDEARRAARKCYYLLQL